MSACSSAYDVLSLDLAQIERCFGSFLKTVWTESASTRSAACNGATARGLFHSSIARQQVVASDIVWKCTVIAIGVAHEQLREIGIGRFSPEFAQRLNSGETG